MFVNLAGTLCFVGAMVWAAIADVVTLKIQNRLVLLLLTSYSVLAVVSDMSWLSIGQNVIVGAFILIGMFALFSFGWIGGGDAKLAAVVALWLGMEHTLAFVLTTAVFGGALTAILIQVRLLPLPIQCLRTPWIVRLHAPETGVPYGVAIAAGGLINFPATHWMAPLT